MRVTLLDLLGSCSYPSVGNSSEEQPVVQLLFVKIKASAIVLPAGFSQRGFRAAGFFQEGSEQVLPTEV